jgi:hypothetical protein
VDKHTPTRLAVQQLRNTLRLNATTSLAGGIVAAVASGPLDRVLNTGHPGLVRLAGLGLVVFAVDHVALAGARTSRLLRWTPAVVAADTAWVVASAATIAAGWYGGAGAVVVTVVAAMVAGFAVRQAATWRAARASASEQMAAIDERPPVEVVRVERAVAGERPAAWQVITDHELYGRLAPNLSRVHATTGDGPELQRSCANRKGEEWQETCTLWEEGHRYEVAVDTAAYPYPLAVMRGSWSVEPDQPGKVRLVMHFRFQPRPGLRGRLFAALMHAAFPVVLRRIVRGWQPEIARRSR